MGRSSLVTVKRLTTLNLGMEKLTIVGGLPYSYMYIYFKKYIGVCPNNGSLLYNSVYLLCTKLCSFELKMSYFEILRLSLLLAPLTKTAWRRMANGGENYYICDFIEV